MSGRSGHRIQIAHGSEPNACGGGRAALRFVATAMFVAIAAFAATLAPAQAQFTGIYGFGDSYADTGAGPGGAFRLAGPANSPPGCSVVPTPANCRFTGGTNFVESLQAIYGLQGLTNYAIGGARTDNTNTLTPQLGVTLPGFPYELQQFGLSGTRFSKSDLIVVSIGGNDLSASASGETIAQIQADATASALRALYGDPGAGFANGGVAQLIAAGANNIAWLSTGSSKYFPVPPGTFTIPQRDAWANTYYLQTEQMLAPYANAGVRIFLFNFAILQERIFANPTQYGFNSDPLCQANPTGGPAGPANCFYNNSVHPTAAAMALIANFMANQINSPTTVVPQGGVAASLASGFAGSVLDRLDADRTFAPFGMGSAMAYAGPTKAPGPVAADHPWSIYSNVDYGGGSRGAQFLASGYDYTAVGGTVGIEYRHDLNWRFGGVFSYANPDVNLSVQNAHNHIDAFQFAGYGSYTEPHWFADGLIAYGRQAFSLDRQGVTDTITASTHADTFTAAARGGYLFDVGPLRAGPIGGLVYTHAAIQGYTEAGDILLTMAVDRQSLDNLTGDAGVQLRYPFVVGKALYNPFVNVTAEHDFLGSGRIVTTTLVTAPLLPVLTPVPDTGGQTYGKVAAGISAAVTGNLSATVTAATTFARDGGNDFAISTGIKGLF